MLLRLGYFCKAAVVALVGFESSLNKCRYRSGKLQKRAVEYFLNKNRLFTAKIDALLNFWIYEMVRSPERIAV